VCAKCEKPFLGHRHYEKKGLAYCEIHYHQLFGNLCFVCNQVIGGDGMCFTWTFDCTGVLELKTLLESSVRKAGYITILYISVLKHSHYYCHCWHHYCLCCYCYHQSLCTLPLRSIFTHIKNCSFTLTTSFFFSLKKSWVCCCVLWRYVIHMHWYIFHCGWLCSACPFLRLFCGALMCLPSNHRHSAYQRVDYRFSTKFIEILETNCVCLNTLHLFLLIEVGRNRIGHLFILLLITYKVLVC
jgi:hypothetical protein